MPEGSETPAKQAAPAPDPPFGRARLKAFLDGYHAHLATRAAAGGPVVFLQFGGNVREIFEALGYAVSYPCIGSILSGIDGTAAEAIRVAEDAGHAATACALMKADLGRRIAASRPGRLPLIGTGAPIVRPSLLVCPHAGCSTYIKWYEALGELTLAPMVMLDVPPRRTDGIPESDVRYVVDQLRDLAAVAGRLGGRRIDERRLCAIVARSRRAEDAWVRFLHRETARPAPYDALAEGTPVMAPVFLARGTRACVDFYRGLRGDLARRRPLPAERFRVLFDGAPPWPAIDGLSAEFSRWGARVVVSSYTRIGGVFDDFRHDPADPWRSMATHALSGWNGLDLDLRRRWLLRWAREYRCDAVVVHAVASCKATAVGQADALEQYRAADLPVLLLQSDLVDARYYHAAPMRSRIDAFFHSLRARGGEAGRAAA